MVNDRAEPDISSLIPHSGSMCLLSKVTAWDNERIHCVAESHNDLSNPLRRDGILPIVMGVEYASQAMAAHHGLRSMQSGSPRRGYIGLINNVRWQVERLDCVGEFLEVHATMLQSLSDCSRYEFSLMAGQKILLTGDAMVVLD